jgi:hypothetical protein
VDAEKHIQEAIRQHEERAAYRARESLAESLRVGPYDETSGDFSLWIGGGPSDKGWRIGRWSTRAEACDEGSKLAIAIRRPRAP